MSMYKRKPGHEQPYWALGQYKIRIPFVHFKLELPEIIQGIVLFTVGLSMIEIMTSVMGISYEAALTITILNQFLMLLPSIMGVPFVGGFITALIPVLILFLEGYEPGTEAIQAVIAVQIMLAVIFLLFGKTGLGEILVKTLPASLKAGILIGAGITAIMAEIQPGGRLTETPVAITIGTLLCFYMMFSLSFKALSKRKKLVGRIASFGIIPAIFIAIFIGWAVGEYPTPNVEWGITTPSFGAVWDITPFVIGFPTIEMFIGAIPIAILAYVIAYGDIIVGDKLIERVKQFRPDEKIEYTFKQVHMVTFFRSVLNALFVPHPGMAGPIFTAGTATVAERYTNGRTSMDSIFSGMNSLSIAFSIGIFLLPVVTFFQPFLPIALALTLILTGYLCITVGMQQIKTETEMGVAGVMAIVLAIYGAAPGLVVGILLYFLIQRSRQKQDGPKQQESEDEKKKIS
ncbi:solute carrier family 23 protein [Bacillus sp. Marseille-P3800]|uniref:solute carrier family 23 protein n=1 Tax=Bacillus sp. Marseille-P3800 TaxID=2014782 RepID=UPI000C076376|nr:solute carrier family 23 protein [Bacillus sp. Marseille-P3800]